MLRIRLRRVGAKKQPAYRVVVADQRAARDGSFVDQIGHYNPRTEPPTVVIDEDKALRWLRNGAKPSEAVERMLKRLGTLDRVARARWSGRGMRDLVEYIVKAIAARPDDVKVTEEEDDGRLVFRVAVAPEDKGKVIGRGGRVAQSIRALLRVAAVKEGTRAVLEID